MHRQETWRLGPAEVAQLVCPTCRGGLEHHRGDGQREDASAGSRVDRGWLSCRWCGESWAVVRGLPRLYREAEVQGNDRLLRLFYDYLPRLHDPAVRLTLPLFQTGRLGVKALLASASASATTSTSTSTSGSEHEMRGGYMPRLELGALAARSGPGPARILEIGIGTGANLPWVRAALPAGLPVEIWGLDLSEGMLAQCRRRLRAHPDPSVRLIMGDAHALPFPDGHFDRVFHVGALGSFRDPARALAEMARVARPATPIVAVDEQLDPARRHGLLSRALFRLVTFYEAHPHAPVEALPPGATDVLAEQVSPFFYSLRFRMPAPPRRS